MKFSAGSPDYNDFQLPRATGKLFSPSFSDGTNDGKYERKTKDARSKMTMPKFLVPEYRHPTSSAWRGPVMPPKLRTRRPAAAMVKARSTSAPAARTTRGSEEGAGPPEVRLRHGKSF